MSKKSLITREKILAKALEMFNEKGVEYVGLRELAALLNMRVSNITYYFPTKDDLVNQLSVDLNQLNSELIVIDTGITMLSFLQMFKQAAAIQIRYKGLLLSMVHLLTQNKAILERHKETQISRNFILTQNIDHLVKSGYLEFNTETQKEYLIYTIALIAKFWISESAISFRQMNVEEQINLYLSMVANMVSPYVTEKGLNDIRTFFAG